MARGLRVIDLRAWHHVTARGNERRAIFRDDRDRLKFLEYLGEMVERFGLKLHAYVLMDNHYHLLVELAEVNLSKACQWLNGSYTMWFNRRHGRCGHLLQGRFKSVLVDPRTWGVGMGAYIHLNPARVQELGLGKAQQAQARDWKLKGPPAEVVRERIAVVRSHRWSSYRAYAGLAAAPKWLEMAETLELAGIKTGDPEGCAKYRRLVEGQLREGTASRPWEELQDRVFLGAAEFVTQARKRLAEAGTSLGLKGKRGARVSRSVELVEVIAAVEGLKGEKWSEFRDRYGDWGRDAVLFAGRRLTRLSLTELAAAAGLANDRAAWMAINRYRNRLKQDGTLRRKTKEILKKWNVEV